MQKSFTFVHVNVNNVVFLRVGRLNLFAKFLKMEQKSVASRHRLLKLHENLNRFVIRILVLTLTLGKTIYRYLPVPLVDCGVDIGGVVERSFCFV